MELIISRIQEKIAEKDLSVHSLEKQAGLKRGVLQNVLYGRSKNPGIEIIRALAETLECTVSDLIGENKPSFASRPEAQKQPSSSSEPFISWNADLYKKCFDKVDKITKKEGMTLSNAKTLDFVNEVYQYTIEQERPTPDDYFIKWLLTKSFMRE